VWHSRFGSGDFVDVPAGAAGCVLRDAMPAGDASLLCEHGADGGRLLPSPFEFAVYDCA